MDDNARGTKRGRLEEEEDGVFLYEGGEVAKEGKGEIIRVRIGSQVKDIPGNAFQGCINLAKVHFDEGMLQVIGGNAFYGCTALQQVTIPPSVTKLDDGAFWGCSSVSKVQFHEGLQFMGCSVFRDCTALQQVNIPSSVTELGSYAFYWCTNLSEVHFNDGLLQVIGECAFYRSALQQANIPRSVKKLGSYAFAHCTNLTEVRLNDGLQVIGDTAFRGCKMLQQVTIPSSVTKLDRSAFEGCINLATVQFREGSLQLIRSYAFYDCTALRSVTVPSSVTKLGHYAFSRCANLTEVILMGGEMLINRGFLDRGLFSGEGALNKKRFNEMFGSGFCTFSDCPLNAIKISIPRALSLRMARLRQECRLSVEGRIRDMRRLELTQDGTILACFPLIRWTWNAFDIEDTGNQTAESLHQVLRLISFHELKESSTLIELAMWKSRIGEDGARADYCISVPDPAKTLIMEYCGFTGFLEPAI